METTVHTKYLRIYLAASERPHRRKATNDTQKKDWKNFEISAARVFIDGIFGTFLFDKAA